MNGIANASQVDTQGPGKARFFPRPKAAAGLLVEYGDAFGPAVAPLRNVADGQYVTARGRISNVHVHGTDNGPRATFVLTSNTGDQAIVALDTKAYLAHFGLLVDGQWAEVRGHVKRPFDSMPPFIQGLSVRLSYNA
jgi:hypothetical protein